MLTSADPYFTYGQQYWVLLALNAYIFSWVPQLLTDAASSFEVNCVFSFWRLVCSKLRNQLGTEKATNFSFFKSMNKHAPHDYA